MSKQSIHSLSDLYTLIPGATPPDSRPEKPDASPMAAMNIVLKIRVEKKGRGGKTVTVITGFFHEKDDLQSWARELKTLCGAGGTVDNDAIVIQGAHAPKIAAWFRGKGFAVKGA